MVPQQSNRKLGCTLKQMGREEVGLQQEHTGIRAAGGAGTLRKGSVLSSRFSAPKGTVTQEDSRGDRGRWKTALAT